MGYQLETTALNFQENYNAFRIRCIMLILGKIKNNSKKCKQPIYKEILF